MIPIVASVGEFFKFQIFMVRSKVIISESHEVFAYKFSSCYFAKSRRRLKCVVTDKVGYSGCNDGDTSFDFEWDLHTCRNPILMQRV